LTNRWFGEARCLVGHGRPRCKNIAGPRNFCFGAGRGEGNADPAFHLDDKGGDLMEPQSERCELALGEVLDLGNGVTNREHRPVGGGVQHKATLIGQQ
jgi:hypothetical protein